MDNGMKLYYVSDYNRFCDVDGNLIHDLHNLLEPWQIDYIKLTLDSECSITMFCKDGQMVEVIYMDVLGTDGDDIRYVQWGDDIYDCTLCISY